MAFVVIGLVLVVLKWFGWTFVAAWSWWAVLAPFGLAVAWWLLADWTGMTQRTAMRREQERAARRREQQYEALGMRAGPADRDGRKRR